MDIGELLGAALVVGFVVWLANWECIATLRATELKTVGRHEGHPGATPNGHIIETDASEPALRAAARSPG
jgi:hypothetical protein